MVRPLLLLLGPWPVGQQTAQQAWCRGMPHILKQMQLWCVWRAPQAQAPPPRLLPTQLLLVRLALMLR